MLQPGEDICCEDDEGVEVRGIQAWVNLSL